MQIRPPWFTRVRGVLEYCFNGILLIIPYDINTIDIINIMNIMNIININLCGERRERRENFR